MSWFSKLFKRKQPRKAEPDQAASATPSGGDTAEAGELHLPDYATFDGRGDKPVPPSGTTAILHFDFVSVFPAVSWFSNMGYDADYPEGFSYRLLTARHEPAGEYECVVIRDLGERGKAILRRFMLPKDQFPGVIEELVRKYEPALGIRFARRDFSQARTPEEFQRALTGGKPPPLPPQSPH